MKFLNFIIISVCIVFLLPVCCFADAVFRSEGVTDLSSVRLLLPDHEQFTVLRSPDKQQGSLICRGAELSDYDSFAQSDADSLVFVPFCEDVFCKIELLPQGENDPLSIIITNSDSTLLSYSVEAGQYCWAWAQNNYFSHIADAV